MLGSHRLFNKGFHMYEETHHIPLVIRWPGVTSPGTTCDEFVNLVDLMPTFLEMAGCNSAGYRWEVYLAVAEIGNRCGVAR